jgi:transcriptional regulator with XRE-family HTH domain
MLNNVLIVSRIEEIRKNHQLTSASFATKIGVQRSAMSHILSGRNKPSLDFLMKIHDAFDEVNLEWLILGKSSSLSKYSENLSNFEKARGTKVLDEMTTEPKTITTNPSQSNEAPKEIIYIYADGKFKHFKPKN